MSRQILRRVAVSARVWIALFVLVVCLAVVLTQLPVNLKGSVEERGPLLVRTAIAPERPAAERLAILQRSLAAIEAGARDLPRDRWDASYVVQTLGNDPQVLTTWTAQNTSWIPYRGVLRGPVGVLNDRLGNSVDRSLLLARLLEAAGHSVRLAHAEMDRARAAELLPRLIMERSLAATASAAGLRAQPVQDVEEVAQAYELDVAEVRDSAAAQWEDQSNLIWKLRDRVADQSARLSAQAKNARSSSDETSRCTAAITALQDHWWVQRQEDGRWIDVDLFALDGSETAIADAPKEVVALDDLSPDLFHTITIRVGIERWNAGALSQRTVLEHALRPFELAGKPISVRFWPAQWTSDFDPESKDRQRDSRVAALAQREWEASLFVDDEAVAQATLDASGKTRKPAGGGPMSGIASGFARSTGGAPAGSAESELTAVWFEYDISSPGESPRTLRRTVFDVLDAQSRQQPPTRLALNEEQRLTRSLSLMMQTEILPVSSRLSDEFVLHLASQSLLANRAGLRAAVSGTLTDQRDLPDEIRNSFREWLSPLYALAYARLEWSPHEDRIFVDRPGLLTRHVFLQDAGGRIRWRDATDIVANEIGVDLLIPDAFDVRLTQGVFDTNAEAVLQRGRVIGNTGEAFALARDWTRLSVADAGKRQGSIVEDLRAGNIVIAPPRETEAAGFESWWRIDPATGHTLGIGENGWGASMGEYAYTFAITAASALAECSAMHEFVAVARDGQDFGTGTWDSLGTCVAAAFSAGALATVFLLAVTVMPQLFFRTWARSGAMPGMPPGAGAAAGRGASPAHGTPPPRSAPPASAAGSPPLGSAPGSPPPASRPPGAAPPGARPPGTRSPKPELGPHKGGDALASLIEDQIKTPPPGGMGWGRVGDHLGKEGADALRRADTAARNAYNAARNSGMNDEMANKISADAWASAWNEHKPWMPGARWNPGPGSTQPMGATQPNPGSSQPELGGTDPRAPGPVHGRPVFVGGTTCRMGNCVSPFASSNAGFGSLPGAVGGGVPKP